jgi:hypothetical protein
MILTKQNFTASTVVSIRLSSGDEIVASFVEMDALTVTVKNPLIIKTVKGPNGQDIVGIEPFMLGIERNTSVPISRNSVAVIIKTHDMLTNDYLNMMAAGEKLTQ